MTRRINQAKRLSLLKRIRTSLKRCSVGIIERIPGVFGLNFKEDYLGMHIAVYTEKALGASTCKQIEYVLGPDVPVVFYLKKIKGAKNASASKE